MLKNTNNNRILLQKFKIYEKISKIFFINSKKIFINMLILIQSINEIANNYFYLINIFKIKISI